MPGMTAAALPAATFHQRGESIDIGPAPAGGYKSGQIVQVAGFVGIVNVGVAEGKMTSATITNVYNIANSGITPSAGDPVDVSIANQNVVATTLGDAKAGTVMYDVAAGTDPVPVLLNAAPLA